MSNSGGAGGLLQDLLSLNGTLCGLQLGIVDRCGRRGSGCHADSFRDGGHACSGYNRELLMGEL